MKNVWYILALGLTLSITSCNIKSESPQLLQESTSGAKTVDVSKEFHIPINGRGNTIEQQNIIDKDKITTDPTKIMWMHLIDFNGRMYLRTPVRCKVTSSGKRLEPTSCAAGMANGQGADEYYGARTPEGYRTSELIRVDGTYGNSDEYVYWFDPMGHYFQKGDGYLLSDIPIDIKDPINEITGLYQVQEQAAKWQKEQESKLK